MRLPNRQDLRDSLPEGAKVSDEELERALDLAPEVLELMTGSPVRKRTIQERRFLWNRPEHLRYFPARNVRADGHPITHTELTGTVEPELDPSNYLVTYEVGYDRNDFPAILSQAVAHLARHHVYQRPEDREEAAAAIEIIRLGVRKTRRDRESDQAVRTGPS